MRGRRKSCRRGIDRSEAGESAGGGVEENVTDIGKVTDDGENDVGLGSDGFGRIGPVNTERERSDWALDWVRVTMVRV